MRVGSSTADGNSKLISQRSHVAGKSGGKFSGKDGLTEEVVRSYCVRLGTVSTL